ncbi:putative elongator complex protein 1 [Coemansia furcata]|nr:putative elongator complex protein 1 [Coemansia furcata]
MEHGSVFIALHSGNIFAARVRQQDNPMEPELVGMVDLGSLACAWSLDDEVMALVTGEARLLLKTQDFDVVYEFPLAHGQQGEDAPVMLVGDKRETQYHDKTGKAAALESSDFVMQISWRRDGTFIAEEFIAQSGAHKLRILPQEFWLCSTTELSEALKHMLSWRLSGATDQCHDVMFSSATGLCTIDAPVPIAHMVFGHGSDVHVCRAQGMDHGAHGCRRPQTCVVLLSLSFLLGGARILVMYAFMQTTEWCMALTEASEIDLIQAIHDMMVHPALLEDIRDIGMAPVLNLVMLLGVLATS